MNDNKNNMILFWASFLTLIAAGMGFSIRNDLLKVWGQEFGFTQSELGKITGMGLFGFGLTIIFFSFFADVVGYGKLMIVAFLLHVAAAVTTLATPYAYAQWGKEGAYLALYIGAFAFSLANGTCEAVINPLTATIFPRNKTHWLNILHAGWPGGLVLGALGGLVLNQIGVGWQVKWGIVLAPILLYGVMMLGRPFPTSEAKASGVTLGDMMRQVGSLGAGVVMIFMGLWFAKDIVPGLLKGLGDLPTWVAPSAGWSVAALLWVGYTVVVGFSLGYWILTFLYLLHAMVGYVELGTDSWIIDITKTVLASDDLALVAFIWTNVLMFTLRFFAGPIVHKISPLGLLFASAVCGTAGLWLLGQPLSNETWMWMAAVTVYGLGKTFYWPTMLGVVSERYPRGGALALGLCGGIGMLSAGLLGGPVIGYQQDYAATRQIEVAAPQTYERYKADKASAPLPGLQQIAGLDNGKVGVLQDYLELQAKLEKAEKTGKPLKEEEKKLKIEKDMALVENDGRTLSRSEVAERYTASKQDGGTPLKGEESIQLLYYWWVDHGKPNVGEDKEPVRAATLQGGKQALTWTAVVPAVMAIGYLLLVLYFLAVGGYKAEVLVGHGAEDEKFTGGTEGPGEG